MKSFYFHRTLARNYHEGFLNRSTIKEIFDKKNFFKVPIGNISIEQIEDVLKSTQEISDSQKIAYKNFIMLFVHKYGINDTPSHINYLLLCGSVKDSELLKGKDCDISLNMKYIKGSLYIECNFSYKEEAADNPYLEAKTIYRVDINVNNNGGWSSRFGIVFCRITCNSRCRRILDVRNFFEKIMDFLLFLVGRIILDINSDKFYKLKPKIKSKAVFFQSNDCTSINEVKVGSNVVYKKDEDNQIGYASSSNLSRT